MTFGEQIYPTTSVPIYSLYQGPLSKERISKGETELVVKTGDAIIKANPKISDEHETPFLIGAKVIGLYIKVCGQTKIRKEL